MAIRPTGQYVSKNKGAKKSKTRAKENRFSKKQFFNLCTPSIFPVTTHGKTSHPRTKSRQDLSQYLIGRTFSVNQGDLNGQNTETHRNFSFKVTKVRGSDCLGTFNGMYMARDKVTSMIRKWYSLIDAHLDLTTSDGSVWRFFVIATTLRLHGQVKKNSYCQTSTAKEIRKVIFDVLKEQIEGLDVDKVIKGLSNESFGKEIESRCSKIFPVSAAIVKVKPVKNVQVVEAMRPENILSNSTEQKNEFIIAEGA